MFALGGGAISSKSDNQTIIARSTIESMFIALEQVGSEAEWSRKFYVNINLLTDELSATPFDVKDELLIPPMKDELLILFMKDKLLSLR